MLQCSAPYINSQGDEVFLITYSNGTTEECKYLRKGRDW